MYERGLTHRLRLRQEKAKLKGLQKMLRQEQRKLLAAQRGQERLARLPATVVRSYRYAWQFQPDAVRLARDGHKVTKTMYGDTRTVRDGHGGDRRDDHGGGHGDGRGSRHRATHRGSGGTPLFAAP